ncbi:MAG TPA: sulfonate ABC transporter ATP-binding protein, partial [Sutterella sp.]|nr:sulfonate ABC transporter ATP-binding protein [Sutterella sp.]
TLSGGMAQRVALARALVVTPDLMLMDEPFASLDAITKSALQDDFLKIKKSSNLSAVLVTHDVFEAVKLADRVFVMSEGALDSEVNLRDLTDIERFERAKALLVRLKNKTRDHEPDRQ